VGESDVAVFRRFHAAWSEADLAAALALTDPHIVVRPLHRALFTRSEFRGHEGVTAWFHEMTDPWDRFEALVEDARETPEGIIALLRLVAHRGDERLHLRVGVVCQMRAGRILSLTARNAGDVEALLSNRRPAE
jgi:ketosteroid isomerase-like protein